MVRFARKLGGTDGAEIAEVAMVLPLVFTFLLGIVWFGRAFQIYSTITQAAQQGVLVAARPSCATCVPGDWNGFPDDAAVTNAVFAVMNASNLDTGQIGQYAPASPQPCRTAIPTVPPMQCPHYSNNVSICRSVWLNPSAEDPPPAPQCGMIVSFQYPFTFNLPFTSLNLQQITIKTQAQSRMEN